MQVQSIFLIMKDQIGRLNNISHCNCLAKLPQELQEQLKTLFSWPNTYLKWPESPNNNTQKKWTDIGLLGSMAW